MGKIVIEGKEHFCSKIVQEEIEWLDIRVKTAIHLAKKIEDIQNEIDEFTDKKQAEIQDLLNQLKKI
jgi:uncharacterized protein YlxW (UPF0749 family)